MREIRRASTALSWSSVRLGREFEGRVERLSFSGRKRFGVSALRFYFVCFSVGLSVISRGFVGFGVWRVF